VTPLTGATPDLFREPSLKLRGGNDHAVRGDRLLEHTSEISLSEEMHGPPGDRRLDYEPSFIIRGLARLFLELSPR
jgi:hypothetical protein